MCCTTTFRATPEMPSLTTLVALVTGGASVNQDSAYCQRDGEDKDEKQKNTYELHESLVPLSECVPDERKHAAPIHHAYPEEHRSRGGQLGERRCFPPRRHRPRAIER